MFFVKWTERSLSFWVTISIILTALPLAASAVAVHLLFSRDVIAAYDDVAARYRDHIGPTHQLEVALWEAHAHADQYLETREEASLAAYRESRRTIDSKFWHLKHSLNVASTEGAALERATAHWARADRLASQSLLGASPVDLKSADEVDVEIAGAVRELHTVEASLAEDLSSDHQAAIAAYQRSNWISGVAATVSLLTLLVGVAIISRIMLANVDRLVNGARKFAEGDRDHAIDIKVPLELREVAREFNRMIGRIREVEAALTEEARHDPMTGLPNRRSFEAGLSDAFARLHRFGEPCALIMLDIDHVKRVNDTHGHAAGDDVLRATGATIKGTIRAVDKAFRIGGEEFALLLAGTDFAGAAAGAERLRHAIAGMVVKTEGVAVAVTASLGIAQASASVSKEELCRAADRALYEAKTSGRNRVVTASASSEVA